MASPGLRVVLVGDGERADRVARRLADVERVRVHRQADPSGSLATRGGVDCAVLASRAVVDRAERLPDVPTVAVVEDADVPEGVDRVPPADLEALVDRVLAADAGLATEFRRLVDANPAGVVLVRDGEVQYANPALAELHGRDRADLVGADPEELIADSDRERAAALFEDGLPAGESRRRQFTGRGDDGTTAELEVHSTRLDGGGVLSTVIDVTERSRRRETVTALHDATVELMTVRDPEAVAWLTVQTSRDELDLPYTGVFLWDETRELLRPAANTARARKVLGPPPTFERGEGIAGKAFEEGETILLDDARTDPRGLDDNDSNIRNYCVVPLGEHGVLTVASPEVGDLDDFSVEVAELLATGAETALDRIARERTLREREQELRRQNERLDEFASVVSHDLRGPLNVVAGAAELARETGDLDHLDEVVDAAARMDRLIEDLLTLAREGRVVGETEPVDLATVAETAWGHCDTAGATLDVAPCGRLRADPGRLRELLENVFGNAVEHGGPDVRVEVGPIDGEGFYVADDGQGIPPEQRDGVFDRGFTTASEGTGFGLAIAAGIAEAHGWTVAVGDREGGGARFEFTGVDRA